MKSDFRVRRLCLNMIVKNEGERIVRALSSALPYISSYAITDTGSSDNTKELIESFFADAGITGEVNTAEFVDFGQARNAALQHGRDFVSRSGVYADYFLLMDADMELVVEDPEVFHNLSAEAYSLVQKAGALAYPNTRLLRVGSFAKYVGVTHEYLDAAAIEHEGAHFIDHADGANRPDKFKRDIRLLNSALAKDPLNGRYWYYLAQSHRDAGDFKRAAECYKKRLPLGGWDEETWSAQLGYATALKDQGLEAEYVANMLKAYNMRPHRSETLYDLAKYFREKGDSATALLFIKQGLAVPKSKDWLFVNQFVHDWGFKHEFSICAYYDPKERAAGALLNDELSLSKEAPQFVRAISQQNRYWYLEKLASIAPSFQQTQLKFQPPHAGYTPMNPCVTTYNNDVICNIRCVNYRMDSEGRYLINGTDGEANSTNPIDTKNFVVKLIDDLDGRLSIGGYAEEIVWPRPEPQFDLVTGMEDVRLYVDGDDLWASATVREQNPGGVCQQLRFRLEYDADERIWRVAKWNRMSGTGTHEKNWMPVDGSCLRPQKFMYRLDRVITAPPPTVPELKHELDLDVGSISGSSQLIPFKAGWLAVVHESGLIPGTVRRFYQHRFVWFDHTMKMRRITAPFCFQDKQIEFCAGLTEAPGGDLLLSYGIRDAEAWVGLISHEDVATMLWVCK